MAQPCYSSRGSCPICMQRGSAGAQPSSVMWCSRWFQQKPQTGPQGVGAQGPSPAQDETGAKLHRKLVPGPAQAWEPR